MSAESALRVNQLVTEISDLRVLDLAEGKSVRGRLDELNRRLGEVRGFAQRLDAMFVNLPSGGSAKGTSSRRTATPASRRSRKSTTSKSVVARKRASAPTKPARSKPARSKPTRSKPARSKPTRSKPTRSKPARSKPARSKPARSGRRGPGEFNATPFILECVQKAGRTGVRPMTIVEQVVAEAPGQHVRPSALVSTILARLATRGAVTRRDGRWYPR